MSEAMTRADYDEYVDRCVIDAVMRQKFRDHDAALRQEIERLEQALRLHLAVSPDDPVLITPVERQLVAMRQERDEARSMRDFAKEDRDLYYQRWEAVSKEQDSLNAKCVKAELEWDNERNDLKATLARVEGERDNLVKIVAAQSKGLAHDDRSYEQLERELVMVKDERDQWWKTASERTIALDTQAKRLAHAEQQRDFYKTQSEGYYHEAAIAYDKRNQAEQREARLRAALEDLVNNIAGLSAYDRIDAINDEVFEQAQQALSQLPTASSRQDGSDQGKTPS